MFVVCPSCKTLYPVTAEYLRLAAGQVRCSNCQTRFDASRAVFDDPQQALDYDYPPPQALKGEIDALIDQALDQGGADLSEPRRVATAESGRSSPPLVGDPSRVAMDYYAWPISSEFRESETIELASPEPVEPVDVPPEYLSEHLLDSSGSGHARTAWGAIAAALLLTLGLMLQYAYIERYQLVQVSVLRVAIEWLCQPLDCRLPLRRDLARVEMIEREVRQHPNVDDALLVHASFSNRADFIQAYPVLQISFSDVAGTPVAVRRFMPEEYLPPSSTDPRNGMSPGEQALVMLEVIDPGDRAVSFQFDFM